MRYWTDGACYPNPGCGGYAVVDVNGELIVSGYSMDTTNNRMELMAVISAMKHSPSGGVVFTDSRYCVDAITKWYDGWCKKNKLADKKNLDLIKEGYELFVDKKISIIWIKRESHEMNMVADEHSKEMASSAYYEKMGISLPHDAWDLYR